MEQQTRYYFIKLDQAYLANQGVGKAIEQLENAWKGSSPELTFNYSFLDANFDHQYKGDKTFGSLFLFFSGFAIFITCLGLFGLVSFIAQQRTKEIGIRRILGASVQNILTLLSSDFFGLIIIATIAAVPLTTYFRSNGSGHTLSGSNSMLSC